MKSKLLLASLVLLSITACSTKFTINGLMCPTDDQNVIQADLNECKVYDLEKVDQALSPESCKCLEEKGYVVDLNASK